MEPIFCSSKCYVRSMTSEPQHKGGGGGGEGVGDIVIGVGYYMVQNIFSLRNELDSKCYFIGLTFEHIVKAKTGPLLASQLDNEEKIMPLSGFH